MSQYLHIFATPKDNVSDSKPVDLNKLICLKWIGTSEVRSIDSVPYTEDYLQIDKVFVQDILIRHYNNVIKSLQETISRKEKAIDKVADKANITDIEHELICIDELKDEVEVNTCHLHTYQAIVEIMDDNEDWIYFYTNC